MYIIYCFTAEDPYDKSPWMKQKVFFIIHFVSLDQIPKIKICHVVASEHHEVVEGRQRLIVTEVFDSEEAYGYGYIDNDGADSYE